MAFFRKWKSQNKHKKLSEEWALAASIMDISDSNNDELSEVKEDNTTTFDLKYLGCTSIDSEKSQKCTAEAIKSVILLSKSIKIKKIPRVKLNVCPKGIEVLNENAETLIKVSIYKISYCSADGVHPNIFAFVGSEYPKDTEEELKCYVFHCSKRKIAQEVTLTVAKNFECAYEVWRQQINDKILPEKPIIICDKKLVKDSKQNKIHEFENPSLSTENSPRTSISEEEDKLQNDDIRELLIDLSVEVYEKKSKDYLQTTWVSFEDDNNMRNVLVC